VLGLEAMALTLSLNSNRELMMLRLTV
jgi:hypothetical protein